MSERGDGARSPPGTAGTRVEAFTMPPALSGELDRLAARYRDAGGIGMQVLNLLGQQAENLVDRLPQGMRERLEGATVSALRLAMRAAQSTQPAGGPEPAWFERALAAASGAAGGAGGLATSLVELPVTVTVLLRAIQSVAREEGFDPADPAISETCLAVLAADGPLSPAAASGAMEGLDLGLLTTRTALSGRSIASLLQRVAPRLASALGQKLAVQMVPLLGAVAGAATNYAYTGYYQELARVHFGLHRLARAHDIAPHLLAAELRFRLVEAKSDRGHDTP